MLGGALVLLPLLLLRWAPASASTLEITAPSETATAGFYRLSWQGPADARFELEEAGNAGFRAGQLVYSGSDRARVFSGRPDGTYYYRLRAWHSERGTGDWSEPVKVTVAHHPLPRTLAFFAVGGVAFLATLALVITGAWRDSREAQP